MSVDKFDNSRLYTMAELDMRLREARERTLRKKCKTEVTIIVTLKNGGICGLECSETDKNIPIPDTIDTSKPLG